jgi:hypothetical protein
MEEKITLAWVKNKKRILHWLKRIFR